MKDWPRPLRIAAHAGPLARAVYAARMAVLHGESAQPDYQALPPNVRAAYFEIAIRLLSGLTVPEHTHKPVDFLYDYATTVARAQIRRVRT